MKEKEGKKKNLRLFLWATEAEWYKQNNHHEPSWAAKVCESLWWCWMMPDGNCGQSAAEPQVPHVHTHFAEQGLWSPCSPEPAQHRHGQQCCSGDLMVPLLQPSSWQPWCRTSSARATCCWLSLKADFLQIYAENPHFVTKCKQAIILAYVLQRDVEKFTEDAALRSSKFLTCLRPGSGACAGTASPAEDPLCFY